MESKKNLIEKTSRDNNFTKNVKNIVFTTRVTASVTIRNNGKFKFPLLIFD